MRLAGRCACGVLLELAAQDPEDHFTCNGEKRCIRCHEVKPVSAFYPLRAGKYIRSDCKACSKADATKYRRNRKARDPEYVKRVKAQSQKDYTEKKLKYLDARRERYFANREAELARKKALYWANHARYRAVDNAGDRKRRALLKRLRTRRKAA